MPANINILIDTPDREIISPLKVNRKSYRHVKKVEFNDEDNDNNKVNDDDDDRDSRIIHNEIPECPEDNSSDVEDYDNYNNNNEGNKNETTNDLTSTVYYFKPITETMVMVCFYFF